MNYAMVILGVLGLVVVKPFPARAQGLGGGLADRHRKLVETDEGGIPYVTFDGVSYRRIVVSDLRGLSLVSGVRKLDLPGLMVCVEGKFERQPSRNSFTLMGSDRRCVFPRARLGDAAAVNGFVRGDNIWVGGTAQKMPRSSGTSANAGSCYLLVAAVVRLPEDFVLFKQRYDKYRREGSWRKLMGLGRWMEENGKLVRLMADQDSYRTARNRAYRQALQVRGSAADVLQVQDADEHYEIARLYGELLGRADVHRRVEHLRTALAAEPAHRKAAEMIRGLGYVYYAPDGEWVPLAERDARERERKRKLAAEDEARRRAGGTAAGGAPGGSKTGPVVKLDTPARVRAILEVEAKARSGAAGLAALAGGIAEADEAAARRIVWILANTGGTVAREGLRKAAASASVVVRRDALDAFAWLRLLKNLSAALIGERSAEVRSHGISALAEIRTRESVDALIALFSIEDEAVRLEVAGALKRVAGQALVRPQVWRDWWGRNRGTFEFPGP